MREERGKSLRESDILSVKKTPKKAKNTFHIHIWFSRMKKKTLPIHHKISPVGRKGKPKIEIDKTVKSVLEQMLPAWRVSFLGDKA